MLYYDCLKKKKMKKKIIFKKRVFEIVSKIKSGDTMSYKEVAMLAGSPKAYRAVGNILNTNFDPLIPCHRVLRSDGKIGGYNRGVELKREILIRERNLK